MVTKALKDFFKRKTGWKLVSKNSLIYKAATLASYDTIEGDYIEFGVYKGAYFAQSYYAFKQCLENRSRNVHGHFDEKEIEKIKNQWNNMRFIAFDSFLGLPDLKGSDKEGTDFKKGQFMSTKEEFITNLKRLGINSDKILSVEGWFEDTCVEQTKKDYKISKVACVMVDCDLYESAVCALKFIEDLIQEGTIIIFDDWFAFRGSPYKGEQKAFSEFEKRMSGWRFTEFQREGSHRVAFIANKRPL